METLGAVAGGEIVVTVDAIGIGGTLLLRSRFALRARGGAAGDALRGDVQLSREQPSSEGTPLYTSRP